MSTQEETLKEALKFDFSAFPADSLFYERRTVRDRRDEPPGARSPAPPRPARPPSERRQRKERRRRVDPTTFEKQYSEDEMEFMNAMQSFKNQTGRPFPTHGEVLRIALALGYRKTSPGAPIAGLDNLSGPKPAAAAQAAAAVDAEHAQT